MNWQEISIPKIINIPKNKPIIEEIDEVSSSIELTSIKLIETPFCYKIYDRLATPYEILFFSSIIQNIESLSETWVDLKEPTSSFGNLLTELNSYPNPNGVQQEAINSINRLTSEIDNIFNTMDLLLSPISLINILAITICSTLLTLSSILNTLLILLNSLIDRLTCAGSRFTPIIPESQFYAARSELSTFIFSTNTILQDILKRLRYFDTNFTSYLCILPNKEGTCLSGRKLIVNGFLNENIIYTANIKVQSVNCEYCSIPLTSFIVLYPRFKGLENNPYMQDVNILIIDDLGHVKNITINGIGFSCTHTKFDRNNILPDLCEEFVVKSYIEDISIHQLDERTIFNTLTLFLLANPIKC